MAKQERIPTPRPQKTANENHLATAHEHLDRLLAHAASEQVGGRKFWGSITLEVTFQDGEANMVRGYYGFKDKSEKI